MKTLSCRSLVLFAAAMLFATQPAARATITVDTSISYDSLSVSGASWAGTSAYAQAGGNAQYNSSIIPSANPSSAANASDTPVLMGSASGGGTANGSTLTGSASADGFIPGAVAGFDTSAGRSSIYGAVANTSGSSESVTFTVVITYDMTLTADSYGVFGQGETCFALTVNGNPVLFSDDILNVGPNQTQSVDNTITLTDTISLAAGATDYLWAEADSEAMVVNSSTATVPEPPQGGTLAALVALALLLGSFVRHAVKARAARRLMLLAGVVAGLALPALPVRAMYIGSDPPDVCPKCGFPPTRQQLGGIGTSLSEGNMQQNYPIVTISSAFGPTLPLVLTYNSYNADGSKAQLNTGFGFGWSDTYNLYLFQQRGQMFEMGGDGRVTRYYMTLPNNYISDSGYFETLTMQSDGSFIVTNKYQSWWHFGLVPNTPFLVAGPVYRLLQMGDRNGNTNTLTYNSGLLTSVSDTYGRTIQFTYNASNELSTVTDPLGRVTTFQYDAQYRELTQIMDPAGQTVTYTYNSQYQMTSKTDLDGRTYYYMYKSLEPFAVSDSSGQPWLSMSNSDDWAVNETNVAYNLSREYFPATTYDTDGRGNVWTYSYDTNGYITQMTDPNHFTTYYIYDPGTHMISSLTDPNGNTTRYQYDPNGNRTNMTDALGFVTSYTYDPVFNQMTSMTDPLGRITIYEYDAHGNRIEEIDPLGQSNKWTYDSHGNVLTYVDKEGNPTAYTFDANGNPLTVTDPMGNITKYSYDSIGNLISNTDPNGNTTRYQYDSLDRLIGETNALGGITTWTYDGVGRQLTVTDPNTNTTTYLYDLRGRLVQITDALGGTTRNAYDANDNRVAYTNQLDNVTTYTYDSLNRIVQTTNAIGGITHRSYDPDGNDISDTDANGNTTQNVYDALNRVVNVTNALGGVTTCYYSTNGGPACCSPSPGTSLITEMQDPDGNITFYNYDDLNRRVQTIRKNSNTNDAVFPGDAVTTTLYDPDNDVTNLTDPNTNTTQYYYDADDRQIAMIDPVGNSTLTTYDGDGNVIMVTSPNLNITTNAYDALNRLVTVTDQAGPVRTNQYDADGNIIAITDGLGNTTSYTYDGLNRRITATDPLGKTTRTTYDADGNMTSTTDRNGNTTRYFYDAVDRRTSITDPLGDSTITAYDLDNNITNVTDGNGHITRFTYDALNRTITETYPDTAPNTRTNTYDAVGNLIERLDQKGQVTTYYYNDLYFLTNRAYLPSGANDSFTYDPGGRMLTGDRNGWVDTFTYDADNRLTNTVQNGRMLTYTYNIPGRVQTNTQPSGRVLIYNYDARSRLVTLQDQSSPTPPIAAYNYDADNRVVTRNYHNGTTSAYLYNADNWITSITHSNATSLISGLNYTYDNEGNTLYEQDLDNPSGSRTFIYDGLNRLTNYDVGLLSGSTIPSPTFSKVWNLDAVGNWLVITTNGMPQVRTYSASDELLTDNGSNYLYDADGNLTNDNSYNYFYDEENRLTQIQRRSDSAIVGQYYYDALDRRVMSVVDPAAVASTNLYFYDGACIIEEQNPAGTTIATYTYGNYVDEVLSMDRGGQTYYYHANALWTPYALSDSSGNAAERYTYDAYGYVSVLDGNYAAVSPNSWGTPHSTVGNPFLFTGRELDEESGLYFYRTRFMDPQKGRFIVRDLAGVWYDPVNWGNGYAYVGDRPIDLTDPYGEAVVSDEKFDSEQSKKACAEARAAAARGEKVRFKVFVGAAHDSIKGGIISEAEQAGSKGYVVFTYYEDPNRGKGDPQLAVPQNANLNAKARERCGLKEGESCVEEVIISGHNADPIWNVANSLDKKDLCSDSCHIWMAGCWSGTGGSVNNSQQLANNTGCTVHGSLVSLDAGTWYRNKETYTTWTWEGVFQLWRNEPYWREFAPGQPVNPNAPAAPPKKCPSCK